VTTKPIADRCYGTFYGMIPGSLFGTHDFFTFLSAGIALNLVPGQDTLYIIGRSLAQGRRAGIISVLGLGSGCLIHITAAALGLYALFALFPALFTAVTWLGALYLVWLGLSIWIRRDAAAPAFLHTATDESGWVIYRQGLTTNLLNPKVALFFIAFLPQFIDPASGYGALSFLFLGGTFLATGTCWCFVVALGASAFADALRNNPRRQLAFDLAAGLLFIGLGIYILLFHF
jgi:threonine/homoserine/homoserine lactone efflux protein